MNASLTRLIMASTILTGCSLSSSVTVEPLYLLPSDVIKPLSLQDAVNRGEYRYAAEMADTVDKGETTRAEQLALLGRAQLFCGRYDQAREILGRVLERRVSPELRAQVEWDLSQIAFQERDLTEALERAVRARDGGIQVRDWYIEFLESLQEVPIHQIEGSRRAITSFRMGDPDLPRFDLKLNDAVDAEAIIDSGAVMSIVSKRLATRAGIRRLGDGEGLFFGLLGEPIAVTFGLIDTLEIRGMTIRNVPVAVMDDSKLRFFVEKDERFDIDLLIGTSLLREFRMRFDYVRTQLTIDFLEHSQRVPVANQNLFLVDQRPLVHVTINRQGWYPFLLDTGSEVTFLNESKFSIQNVTYGVPRYHGATMQGLGGAQKSGMRVKNVSIGMHQWAGLFEDMPLYSDERPGAVGILGQNFLSNFFVDIDFGRMRVDVHRVDAGGLQD